MAVAQQEVFEEHLGVIAALKDNYTRRDDEVTIQNLHDMKAELDHLCAAREDDAKSIIKGPVWCYRTLSLFSVLFRSSSDRCARSSPCQRWWNLFYCCLSHVLLFSIVSAE